MSQPGHVKIAVTSNGLTKVDANFSATKQIIFYDVGYDSAEFLDCVQFKGGARAGKGPGGGQGGAGCWMSEMETEEADGVDPLSARVDALTGCGILFTKGLSDLAAVRVHAQKVFPVKMEQARDIDEVITQLQRMMNNNPPLWLRKAIGIHAWNGEFQVEPQADAA
jgi:nitrogen fixation protein NifX